MTVLLELLRWVRPVAVTAILLSSPAVLSQTFFKGIEDLPIAPGLKEDADSGMRFDSPGGRIVTAAQPAAAVWMLIVGSMKSAAGAGVEGGGRRISEGRRGASS